MSNALRPGTYSPCVVPASQKTGTIDTLPSPSGGGGARGPLWGGSPDPQREASEASFPLPCLSENNSMGGVPTEEFSLVMRDLCSPISSQAKAPWLEDPFQQTQTQPEFTSQQRKQFTCLVSNIQNVVEKYGTDRVGFLTLTFKPEYDADGEPIQLGFREISRRFNSMWTNYGRKQFVTYLSVKEPHLGGGVKHGELHFHVLVVTHKPITANNDECMAGNYSSACPYLRGLWESLRLHCEGDAKKNLKGHGFGRHHLLPVRRNAEAIARYLAKYLAKCVSIKNRFPHLRGARMLNYAQSWPRVAWPVFSWVGEGGTQWRSFLRSYAHNKGVSCISGMADVFGKKWGHRAGQIFRFWKALPEDNRPDITQPVEIDRVKELFLNRWRSRRDARLNELERSARNRELPHQKLFDAAAVQARLIEVRERIANRRAARELAII